jgi:hypothetical protein
MFMWWRRCFRHIRDAGVTLRSLVEFCSGILLLAWPDKVDYWCHSMAAAMRFKGVPVQHRVPDLAYEACSPKTKF